MESPDPTYQHITSDTVAYEVGDHIRLKDLDELIRTNQVTLEEECYHFGDGSSTSDPGYHPEMWEQCKSHDNHLIITDRYNFVFRCQFGDGTPFISHWGHTWNVIREYIEGFWEEEDDGSLPV